jgi:ATP-dependent Clp protease ATP-binding subunit ClpC
MIRINMSEYQESFSASKIIGSPPGYVGYEEGGQLTEQVRRKPYSVILFDEVEKAHPDIFNLLLQILDDGTLTDAQGRKVDFKNTVIILTSNLGAKSMTEYRPLGFGAAQDEEARRREISHSIMAELKERFRPEFLNRLDGIILFKPLTRDSLHQITALLLGQACDRLREVGLQVELDPSLIDYLSDVGYDEAYGARPIRRAVTKYVEDEIAARMLSGEVKSGDHIRLLANEHGVIIAK